MDVWGSLQRPGFKWLCSFKPCICMDDVQKKVLFKLSKVQRCNASACTKIVYSRLAQELSNEWVEICEEFVLTVKRVIDEAKSTSPH